MSNKITGIPVIVYLSSKIIGSGLIEYRRDGPVIIFENGEVVQDKDEVSFRFQDIHKTKSSIPQISSGLDHNDTIRLKPLFCSLLGYSESPVSYTEMYPPSSEGWISHVSDTAEKAIYTLQKLINKNRYLLTIAQIEDSEVVATYLLHPYEIGLLLIQRDWDVHRELFFKQTPPPNIQELLDASPPTWSFIGRLVEGVTIPKLGIHDSMGETMDQLVPQSFPKSIRKQILAFLSWLDKADIPNEDPIEFWSKNASVDVFRFLVGGHLLCLLESVEHPQYIRLMAMADKGELMLTERPPPESELQNPWYQAKMALEEKFPDRMKRAIEFAIQLNQSNQVVSQLPISKEDAMNSLESWSNRFSMVMQGLMIRGDVFKGALGLKTLVYIGGAHRWPHNHIEFSARLGFQKDYPQQIQFMVLPLSAVERVTRLLPTIHPINWETSTTNLSLYNSEKRKWLMNNSLIAKSMERKKNLLQLEKEFGGSRTKNLRTITPREAKIIDLVSWGLYLGSLESGLYSQYSGVDNKEIEDQLARLKSEKAISLHYSLAMQKLTSISVTAEGSPSNIYSLARALLKHAPSAAVRLTDNGESCFALTRVPEDQAYNILTTWPSIAQDNDIRLKALPVTAYISYRNNLYQRLLKDDGAWDDDVSGLLSQARLRSKDDE